MSKIVPIRPPQLARLKALNDLADAADFLARRYEELENLTDILREDGARLDKLAAAKQTATLDKTDQEALEQCTHALALLDADENYQDDDPECPLRRNIVSGRLAILIGAFPNSGSVGDPETYALMMVDHAFTVAGLTLVALDAACHEIIATLKFLPTTSELLKILKEQASRWERRCWAVADLANTSRRIVARIEAIVGR
jgi:hypothetical protein